MGKKYIKSHYQWNEADHEAAIKEVQKGKSIRQAAKDHHMDEGMISYTIDKVKNDIPLKKQTGKQTLLSKGLESNLEPGRLYIYPL